jgi:phage/plasmid-associated DNA primase
MIEPKGVDSFQMPNRLKILMSSNNDWVIPASADERRYFVLDVPDTRKGDRSYFTRLAAAIEGEELAAFLAYLLSLDLAGFDHRNPPHTDGLNKQKLIGGNTLQKFWLDCLTNGRIDNAALGDDWPADIVCHQLYDAYKEYVHDLGDRYPLTSQLLGTKLRELCPDGKLDVIRPHKPHGDDPRPRRYVLPSLGDARAAFLKAMKIEAHEWPKVEDEP